jgi:hypothetical protein
MNEHAQYISLGFVSYNIVCLRIPRCGANAFEYVSVSKLCPLVAMLSRSILLKTSSCYMTLKMCGRTTCAQNRVKKNTVAGCVKCVSCVVRHGAEDSSKGFKALICRPRSVHGTLLRPVQ